MRTELTKENEKDVFKCTDCKEAVTRKELRKKFKNIPFGKEETKTYYCGCMGWN